MIVFFVESLESMTAHFYRAMDFVVDLGIWLVVGIVYAILGFGFGAYFRHKKHFDSLKLPILGVIIALCVAFPLTVYGCR